MSSSHLILRRPLLLLPPISPSIKVVSNESTLHMRCPKYWSFSFSKKEIPSKEIPGLISFRMDWLDILALQGTLKSLLQHHSSKASVLQRSAFFIVQLSYPYMTYLDGILKSRDITLLTKIRLVKAMVFPVVMYGWESWAEIQPVHSEGDQPWDFFGRNDAKAEAPVLWPPHVKS